jgi:hypothetical protein
MFDLLYRTVLPLVASRPKVYKMQHHLHWGVFLLCKVCVLGTEIQFIVYNDLECEKAANILCIVLSVTDFIITYEFMKHHT